MATLPEVLSKDNYISKLPNNQKHQLRKHHEQRKVTKVGWDSEFYTDENNIQRVLSHQLYIPDTDTEIFIDCIKLGRKPTFNELISEILKVCPEIERILLVTHFSRAEFSSLQDGRELLIGSNFIYSSGTISGNLIIPIDGRDIEIDLYDTYQLTNMSLEQAGKLLGIEKLNIGEYRSNSIIELYKNDYDTFKTYAITDAKVTVYLFMEIEKLVTEFNLKRIPKTIGGIGDRTLCNKIIKIPQNCLGYEKHFRKYDKNKGKPRSIPYLQLPKDFERDFQLIYFGARNETYVHGFIPTTQTIYDYDLKSAYNTAQTTIHDFDILNPIVFNNPEECYNYLLNKPFSYGKCSFTKIDQNDNIKYPILIHKIDDSKTLFLKSAHNYAMSSFEFLVSYKDLKAIEGFRAIIYTAKENLSCIADFQREIREKRNEAKTKGNTFQNNYYKLIGNSTYGKFAQGLSGKKSLKLIYSTKDKAYTDYINKSKLTNTFIASYITSLIRAISYETLNELDKLGILPLYFTTDGFACSNELPSNILYGNFGVLARAVSNHTEKLTGNGQLFELKHAGKGWISIKTRAYSHIEGVEDMEKLTSITGIQIKNKDKAKFIHDEFSSLTQFKDTKYEQKHITPLRDWLLGKEYRDISEEKGFNFDYDFKRKPDFRSIRDENGHIYFETAPFQDVDEYRLYETSYQNFHRGQRVEGKQIGIKNKIITKEHLEDFLIYVTSSIVKPEDSYVIKNLHLKFLSNFMHFRANPKLGKKKISKLLNLSTSTIHRWIETHIEIAKSEETQKLIMLKFRLKEKPLRISLDLHDITDDDTASDFLESTEWDSYDNWELKEWYSEDLFNYLLDYIKYLQDLSFKDDLLELDSLKEKAEMTNNIP